MLIMTELIWGVNYEMIPQMKDEYDSKFEVCVKIASASNLWFTKIINFYFIYSYYIYIYGIM